MGFFGRKRRPTNGPTATPAASTTQAPPNARRRIPPEDDHPLAWLVDYIEGFMRSPSWRNPIKEFLVSKSVGWRQVETGGRNCENVPHGHATVHKEFKILIEDLLMAHLLEIEVEISDFEKVAPLLDQNLTDQLVSVDDFSIFQRMMITTCNSQSAIHGASGSSSSSIDPAAASSSASSSSSYDPEASASSSSNVDPTASSSSSAIPPRSSTGSSSPAEAADGAGSGAGEILSSPCRDEMIVDKSRIGPHSPGYTPGPDSSPLPGATISGPKLVRDCAPPVLLPPEDVPDVPSPDISDYNSPEKKPKVYWKPSAAMRDYSGQLVGRTSGGGEKPGFGNSYSDSAGGGAGAGVGSVGGSIAGGGGIGGRGSEIGRNSGKARLSASEIRKALLGGVH